MLSDEQTRNSNKVDLLSLISRASLTCVTLDVAHYNRQTVPQ